MTDFTTFNTTSHPIITLEGDWNNLLNHGLDKTIDYLVRVNGSYYEALHGTGTTAGTIAYGGADGTGGVAGTDATAVINAALANKGHIKLGPGTFPLTTALLLNEETWLQGSGVTNTSLICDDDGIYSAETAPAANYDVKISDMYVEGPDAGSNYGIYLKRTFSNVTVENVCVKKFESGIVLDNSHAIYLRSVEADYNTWSGITVLESYGPTIYQSKVFGNTSRGIELKLASGCIIAGCDIESNGGVGIHVTHSSDVYTRHANIAHNYFEGNDLDIQDDAYHTEITGNYFIDTTGVNRAILVNKDATQIRDNYFYNYDQYGIYIEATATYTSVSGNDGAGLGLALLLDGGTNTHIYDNPGYITETKGIATVANGNTDTGNIAHGLSFTPQKYHIQVTPTNDLGTATKFWLGTPDATNFKIYVDADPGAGTATFAWKAAHSM
jgi:parallel beta-helix repeat protein